MESGYAPVNGLEMCLSGLARSRRVIAAEAQGHGRTADADCPITYEQMADDAAALIRHLELDAADVIGARDVLLDHARAVRRDADGAGVPPARAEPRRLPGARGEAQDARHDAVRLAGRRHPRHRAPTLIVVGDSDGVTLDHAVQFFKLRGGGVMGDLSGMPASQLAVLPCTSHYVPPGSGLLDRTDWLLSMIVPFLDAGE